MNILARNTRAVFGRELDDARAVFLHRGEAGLEVHGHAGLAGHVAKHLLGDVRLDGVRAAGRRAAAGRFECAGPNSSSLPYGATSRVKYSRAMPPTRARVADVHGAQSAGRHPAEMLARLGDDHSFPHPRRLHGRGHAAGGAAVDADVGFDHLRCYRGSL